VLAERNYLSMAAGTPGTSNTAAVYWGVRNGAAVVATALAGVLVWCAGCSGGPDGAAATHTVPAVSATPTTETGASSFPGYSPASGCAVTRPTMFDPPPGVEPDALFGAASSHGNGQLWVGGLGDDGVIVWSREADGSIDYKLGWWRATQGELRITGRRLDAPAPAVRAHVPSGYGPTGFQASGVSFPTEGCWQVTGQVGATTLTFVTLVLAR